MIRTALASFYLFLSSVIYRKIYSIHIFKKTRFVEELLFYPNNEAMAFPQIEIKWDWASDVYVYIQSDADNIVMWELVKHLRIKWRTVNVWCKQNHG